MIILRPTRPLAVAVAALHACLRDTLPDGWARACVTPRTVDYFERCALIIVSETFRSCAATTDAGEIVSVMSTERRGRELLDCARAVGGRWAVTNQANARMTAAMLGAGFHIWHRVDEEDPALYGPPPLLVWNSGIRPNGLPPLSREGTMMEDAVRNVSGAR